MAKGMSTHKLILHLVGRICLVTKDGRMTAVFLDAQHNPDLDVDVHKPLLGTSLENVYSQKCAEGLLATIGTFGKAYKPRVPDSLGIWELSGYDITIGGVDQSSKGSRKIDDLADLNAIVAALKLGVRIESRVLEGNPRKYGALARLHLPSAANVEAIAVDNKKRTFWPGGHTQKLAEFVTCEIPIKPLKGPTLHFATFDGKRSEPLKLVTHGGDVTVMMSNLCNCVDTDYLPTTRGWIPEDEEFKIYYELLSSPELAIDNRPTPHLRRSMPHGIKPRCYNLSQLKG